MASESSELVIAVSRAFARHAAGLNDVVRAELLTGATPVALVRAELFAFAHAVDSVGGWEFALLLADDEARAAWHRTVATMLENVPVIEAWVLIGMIDGRPRTVGGLTSVNLAHNFAASPFGALRLGKQAW